MWLPAQPVSGRRVGRQRISDHQQSVVHGLGLAPLGPRLHRLDRALRQGLSVLTGGECAFR